MGCFVFVATLQLHAGQTPDDGVVASMSADVRTALQAGRLIGTEEGAARLATRTHTSPDHGRGAPRIGSIEMPG